MSNILWAKIQFRTLIGIAVLISLLITSAWYLTRKSDPPKPLTKEEYLLEEMKTKAYRDSIIWRMNDSAAQVRRNEEMAYRLEDRRRQDSIAIIQKQEIQNQNEIIKKISRTTDSDNFAWFSNRYGTR